MSPTLDRWARTSRRFLRTRSIWHYLLLGGTLLFLYRYTHPRAPLPPQPGDKDYIPPSRIDAGGIDWSKFAVVQYVTDVEYLCNALMMFESLHRLGSKPDRLLLYPHVWDLHPRFESWEAKFLKKAQRAYGVHIMPVRVQRYEDGEATWADSFTKLLAFKQVQYGRVLALDSDATVLKPLDELFLLPNAAVAAPHAYWQGPDKLSSAMLLIEPSQHEYKRVFEAMRNRTSDEYDMDLINDVYGSSSSSAAIIIPNEHWVMSGEFRRADHTAYLGEGKAWDAAKVLAETKFVHFSDWPYPKPWLPATAELRKTIIPPCRPIEGSEEMDCSDRKAWTWLYNDFKKRREDVCTQPFTLYGDTITNGNEWE